MRFLDMTPSRLVLFLVAWIVNNIALSSSQHIRDGPPIFTSIPETNFSCSGRPAGYYSDLEAGCQLYHMCDISQKKASFLCPGYTLFNQKFMVCDHWHAVDCSAAENYYDLNLQIGQVPGNENEITDEGPKKNKLSSRKQPTSKEVTNKPFDRSTTQRSTKPPQSTVGSFIFGRTSSGASTHIFRDFTSIPTSVGVTRTPTTRAVTRVPITRATTQSTAVVRTTTQAPTTRAVTRISTTRATTQRPTALPFLQPSFFLPPRRQLVPIPVNTVIPLISGRGSGRRVKFTPNNLDSEEITNFPKIKLRPLFKPSFFERQNFTVSNEVFTTTPIPEVSKDSSFEDIPSNDTDFSLISNFLLPPLKNSEVSRPALKSAIISPFHLQTPPKSPVILHGPNQEMFTTLILSTRIEPPTRNVEFGSPPSRIIPPQIPFHSGGNRDFFIPSLGLSPPLATNDLEDPVRDNNEHRNSHRMTMTFPTAGSFRRGRPFSFQLNPQCPQCHPAFLLKDCHPCVIIK